MKKCPFCAEEIQDDAIKCRYCNEMLGQPPQKEPSPKSGPWYYSTGGIVVGFCMVGPFILPLVWFNPRYSNVTKIVLTIIILVLTWFLGVVVVHFGKGIWDSYHLLFDLLDGKY